MFFPLPSWLRHAHFLCADNRYTDDIHWKGGCVLGNGMLSWASTMFAWNAKPPNPKYFGKSWKDEWRKRLENASKSWDSIWLSNKEYNDYWKNGSVCEDYSRVDIPGNDNEVKMLQLMSICQRERLSITHFHYSASNRRLDRFLHESRLQIGRPVAQVQGRDRSLVSRVA